MERIEPFYRTIIIPIIYLVQLGGLEPPTSCSTDRRSNQLSYNCIARARPQKGAANGRETRCNARLWQGREAPDCGRFKGAAAFTGAMEGPGVARGVLAKSSGGRSGGRRVVVGGGGGG